MIFMTVGDQIPFDRLTRAIDAWAGRADRDDVFAQIGESDYQAQHIRTVVRLSPPEFERKMIEADLIVGHAGTGTILKAMSLGKPVLVMPRREKFRETRNDHQFATAKFFGKRGVTVAWDESELAHRLELMDQFCAAPESGPLPVAVRRSAVRRPDDIRALSLIGPWASDELIERLREFIVDDGK